MWFSCQIVFELVLNGVIFTLDSYSSAENDVYTPVTKSNYVFLHAKPWIPGGEKPIFTVVIHYWISPVHQFARARTIDEYDVTMRSLRQNTNRRLLKLSLIQPPVQSTTKIAPVQAFPLFVYSHSRLTGWGVTVQRKCKHFTWVSRHGSRVYDVQGHRYMRSTCISTVISCSTNAGLINLIGLFMFNSTTKWAIGYRTWNFSDLLTML